MTDSTPSAAAPFRGGRRAALILILAVASLVLFLWTMRRPIPTVTRERWEEARKLWNSKRPENYRIQTRVTGRQGARYDVTVRNGQVVRALRNGEPLSEGRTQATWTVEGMFDTIAFDVEALARSTRGLSEGERRSLLLRCHFHPDWGYPDVFQRIEWGADSTNPDVSWKVDVFEVLGEAENASAGAR